MHDSIYLYKFLCIYRERQANREGERKSEGTCVDNVMYYVLSRSILITKCSRTSYARMNEIIRSHVFNEMIYQYIEHQIIDVIIDHTRGVIYCLCGAD